MTSVAIEPVPAVLLDFINKNSSFLIVGHAKPDGDCISSSLALASLLKRMNKSVTLFNAGPFYRSEILEYQPLFLRNIPKDADYKKSVLFILDCMDKERLGKFSALAEECTSAVVDHHIKSPTIDGDIHYLSPASPSTSLLIQNIIETVVGTTTKEEAELILFGFLTDSGFFRHLDSDCAEIFAYISRLFSHDISLREWYYKLYANYKFSENQLLGHLLVNTEEHLQGTLLISYKSLEIVEKCGTPFLNHGLLYERLLNTEHVQVCILISELPNISAFDVSLRSLGTVNVGHIAQKFGGGGHAAASGFRWSQDFQALKTTLVNVVQEELSGK